MKKIMSLICICMVLIALTSCGNNTVNNQNDCDGIEDNQMDGGAGWAAARQSIVVDDKEDESSVNTEEKSKNTDNSIENIEDSKEEDKMSNLPIVTIKTKIGDKELKDMKLELYPEKAPNTVANFLTLAQEGYYNGLIFHRIIENFMVQGGDPTGTGMGGPGYGIKGEFSQNGFNNDIKHDRGVISMARSQMPDSAGSQFFICHKAAPHLDGAYAAFGKLIEGEETLDELASVEVDYNDKPTQDCVMTELIVELNGYEVPKVEKQ